MACLLTGRSFIGTELNEEYYTKTQERLSNVDSEERSQSSMAYAPQFKPKK
jgi:DNA modification methylase